MPAATASPPLLQWSAVAAVLAALFYLCGTTYLHSFYEFFDVSVSELDLSANEIIYASYNAIYVFLSRYVMAIVMYGILATVAAWALYLLAATVLRPRLLAGLGVALLVLAVVVSFFVVHEIAAGSGTFEARGKLAALRPASVTLASAAAPLKCLDRKTALMALLGTSPDAAPSGFSAAPYRFLVMGKVSVVLLKVESVAPPRFWTIRIPLATLGDSCSYHQ